MIYGVLVIYKMNDALEGKNCNGDLVVEWVAIFGKRRKFGLNIVK